MIGLARRTHSRARMAAMYVKICGLRDPAHATHAAQAGADAIGVVMSAPSPRNATPEQARAVITAAKRVRPDITTVLVVREMAAEAAAILAQDLGFDVLQLHGGYTFAEMTAARAAHPRVWRATSLTDDPEIHAGAYGEERLLVDGPAAGSGETWDLELLSGLDLGDNWLLAGGLSAMNVAEAVALAKPAGVDVSSGVETSPGVKSIELITEFISAARSNS